MVDQSKSLRDSLIKSGLLSETQVKEAIDDGRRTGETLIRSILRRGVVDETSLISFLEKEMEIPRVDLSSYLVDQKTVNLVPISIAKKYHLIPLFKVGDVLTVAMVDPFDVLALDEVRSRTKCDVEPMVAAAKDIEQAIGQYYGVAGSVEDILKDIGPVEAMQLPVAVESPTEEAPIIKLVNTLVMRALMDNASDVHIEPTEKNIRVRYRVDGLMHEVSTTPLHLLSAIVTRIKVMAKMDIAESRLPQDGRFELKLDNKAVDVRVSTFPTIYGEVIVMRLLDKTNAIFTLAELGFNESNLQQFDETIKRPYGIILVTGPTGSGKTTTLYATLSHIVSPEKNIMTIEDPVEYELAGIRQSQINPKAGLEFANALRSILRQDPDVILVGEIRDLDTARVAIQAALTGHLVFSTLHTNDAAGTLTRLVDMGIEPFLTSSAVAAVIAQRLIRTICPRCKTGYAPSPELLKKIGLDPLQKYEFFQGKGCKTCHSTGYKGRMGIFELLIVDNQVQDLILRKATTNEIKQLAVQHGMKTLRDDGLQKVLEGKTTIDEVLRVTQLD
ncbi:MAG: type II secretion system ATPase GspE [Candidatus Margulisbacteria bacterium]|jgi:type IV pilus assembly protein PilB|nr:type II secretion system ATPase GspE [Candidatus Margulisiibacteriota bacterium]